MIDHQPTPRQPDDPDFGPLVDAYNDRIGRLLAKWRLHALRLIIPPAAFAKLIYALQRFGADTDVERYIDSSKIEYLASEPGSRGTILIDPFKTNDSINFHQTHELRYDGQTISILAITYHENKVRLRETYRIDKPLWAIREVKPEPTRPEPGSADANHQ